MSLQPFWKWIAIYAFRRWAQPNARKPDGIPFNRSPDSECTAYEPRKWQIQDFNDCNTDGHYLCRECCHRNPMGPERAGWLSVYEVTTDGTPVRRERMGAG